jgi:transcriptional regulator with XRE-family HTH domain
VAGLTQVDIAKTIKTDQSRVSKLERGERRLDVVDYVRLCRAIRVDPGDLLASIFPP